jgi:transcriptional regulator with XRE-family HTH domain
MKSSEKNIQNLDSAFESLFENFENDYENEAKIIASKILSGISEITDKKDLKRKDIADLIGTSASYLTQLYRGNKILNLVTLAKLKNKLNLNIELKITEKKYDNLNSDYDYQNLIKKVNIDGKIRDWTVLKNLISKNEETFTSGNKKSMTIIKQQLTA